MGIVNYMMTLTNIWAGSRAGNVVNEIVEKVLILANKCNILNNQSYQANAISFNKSISMPVLITDVHVPRCHAFYKALICLFLDILYHNGDEQFRVVFLQGQSMN